MLAPALTLFAQPVRMRLSEVVPCACLLLPAPFQWRRPAHIQVAALELMLLAQALQHVVFAARVRIPTVLALLPRALQHLQAATPRPVRLRVRLAPSVAIPPLDLIHALLALLVLTLPT